LSVDKHGCLTDEAQKGWDDELIYCGEKLQHHSCKAVCHKYGNTHNCHFGCPRKIQSESVFESGGNSNIMKVDEKDVNNYNPTILICCLHNHDIQSILSGRAAAGAIIYLSDYITKMEDPLYTMATFLSKAVSGASDTENVRLLERQGKQLLQHCLNGFHPVENDLKYALYTIGPRQMKYCELWL
jgi:hypothetical protein